MSDGFTTNLNLDKPVVGGSADSWGTTGNANLDALDAMLGGAIYGLTFSTAGSSGTMSIAAGGASGMALAAFTKTTGSWAVGSGNGALDTGSIANATWYHWYLIQRVDTGVVDVLCSTSATAPTMPANYTRKRLIMSWLTDGSAHWVKMWQKGDKVLYDVPATQVTGTLSDSNAHLLALQSPLGLQCDVLTSMQFDYGSTTDIILVTSPDQADTNPNNGVTAYESMQVTSTMTRASSPQMAIRTNTSSQIRLRANNGSDTASAGYHFWAMGFIHPRGQY